MNFQEQLIITLIDKLAIGVLLLLGGFLLNRAIERYKSRLEKDRSIWKRILDVNKERGSLDQRMGLEIEKGVILPNHRAMIQLIETRIHLAQPDSKLMAELIRYVKRATEYQALRDAGDTSHFSTNEIGIDWLHRDLFEEIKRITETLQSQYNGLVRDARYNDA